jgi:hypothetical protein
MFSRTTPGSLQFSLVVNSQAASGLLVWRSGVVVREKPQLKRTVKRSAGSAMQGEGSEAAHSEYSAK